MMKNETNLEFSRRNLATIPTFNIKQFFKILDSKKREKLSLTDFKNLMIFLEIGNSFIRYFSPLFNLYDTDRDGFLCFKNLVQMISPRDEKYWQMLTTRKKVKVSTRNLELVKKKIFFFFENLF